MNNKTLKTYRDIYTNPVKADIVWDDIEKMLLGLGATLSEGNGSRVRVELNGERAVFHRPHPENTTDKGAIKSVRRFLENARVRL
ncbi:MAG: type II toxin-antitoxin system HicA family toxin [Lachnospiraceae bacterium]|nr:type II toxin-antitoxin system HicA family toxin [Lachnospiraceae bacterium]